ncbi:uncharacterized protein LOC114164492 [Vigna unguiculata]|uniref:uncharacterized protein LOC114164492 n=1 Tax=Vigna unguiculata TaxID=3917 RepID=UPI0010166BE1|nr:uncharacterized protein LOC114164492 [Vigna unguiculata]
MAYSPLNPKSNSHGRSNSLPSRPHPLILECNEHLDSLRASKATTFSSLFLSQNIRCLQDLIECVEKLTHLPLTQDVLLHEREEKWVDGVLDGSLRLLDVCSAAKDALLHTKECTREVHSMIRRKRGGEVELAAEAKKFLTSRKVVKKAISKALANLNATSKSSNISSTTDKDPQTLSLITLLQDTEVATLSTFQTLLQFISASTQQKSNGWLSISKLIQAKRVGCSEVADENEFAQVDAALQSFVFAKTSKSEETKNLQRHLEKMESCIQEFEEGLEFLFRRLIKIRVSLLNVLNH